MDLPRRMNLLNWYIAQFEKELETEAGKNLYLTDEFKHHVAQGEEHAEKNFSNNVLLVLVADLFLFLLARGAELNIQAFGIAFRSFAGAVELLIVLSSYGWFILFMVLIDHIVYSAMHMSIIRVIHGNVKPEHFRVNASAPAFFYRILLARTYLTGSGGIEAFIFVPVLLLNAAAISFHVVAIYQGGVYIKETATFGSLATDIIGVLAIMLHILALVIFVLLRFVPFRST